MKKRLSLLLLLMLLPLSLGACSWFDSQSKEDKIKAKHEEEAKEAATKDKPLPICPQVAIVRELDTFRDYAEEKPDPSQIVGAARMQGIQGDCAYTDEDDDEGAGIDINFDLSLIAQRGPRLGGEHEEFPFFIAVVDPDGNILNKNEMSTTFKFNDDDKKKIYDKTESLHVFIPLGTKDRDEGPNYRVLVGFQLTENQLDILKSQESKREKDAFSSAFDEAPKPEAGAQPTTKAAEQKPSADKKPESPSPSYPTDKDTAPYPAQTHFLTLPHPQETDTAPLPLTPAAPAVSGQPVSPAAQPSPAENSSSGASAPSDKASDQPQSAHPSQ